MKAIINTNTKKVSGLNRVAGPFEVVIDMLDIDPVKKIDDNLYNLSNHPGYFTMDDLIEAKGKKILSDTMRKYIILNEELAEGDLSLSLSTHSANTGFKFLQLLPNGQCRTNKINLPSPTSIVGLYLEADEGISVEIGPNASNFQTISNNQFIHFSEETNSIYLKFKNNTEKHQEVYSYGIIF